MKTSLKRWHLKNILRTFKSNMRESMKLETLKLGEDVGLG